MTATVDQSSSWPGEVVRFWLEETPAEARFKRSDALDESIRRRFGDLYERVRSAPPDPDKLTAELALGAVILFDQFPRNMFRSSPRAFESDACARALADRAIVLGLDRSLSRDGRLFLYLPFEHSECLADQDRSMALIGQLGDPELDRYAVAHREIIRRFGRFPHRNAALGRASTPEETEFLKQPGSSF